MRKSKRLRKSVSMRIQPIEGDPMTLLRKVTAPKANNSDYDEIWIIVDHDGADRTEFLGRCAKKSTKKQKVIGVVSIPCFEVWLVAHYEQIRNYQNQKEAQRHYLHLREINENKLETLLALRADVLARAGERLTDEDTSQVSAQAVHSPIRAKMEANAVARTIMQRHRSRAR